MDYLKRVEDALAESPRRKKINELRHTIHNMKKMDRSQKWRKDIEALNDLLLSASSSDADKANKIIDDTTHGIKSMLQEKAKELHKRIKAIIDKDPETKWIHTLYDTSNNLTNANFNNLNDAQKILNGAANTIGYIEEEKEKTNDELMEMLDKKIKYTPRHEEIRESSPTSSSSNSDLANKEATRAKAIRICAALLIAFIGIFSAIASGIFAGQEGGQSL